MEDVASARRVREGSQGKEGDGRRWKWEKAGWALCSHRLTWRKWVGIQTSFATLAVNTVYKGRVAFSSVKGMAKLGDSGADVIMSLIPVGRKRSNAQLHA